MSSYSLRNDTLIEIATFLVRRWSENDEITVEFSNKKTHFMASFYKKQRKRLNILMNEDGTPSGGKWSFDHENRKRLPKHMDPPQLKQFSYDSSSYDKMKIKVFIVLFFSLVQGDIGHYNFTFESLLAA